MKAPHMQGNHIACTSFRFFLFFSVVFTMSVNGDRFVSAAAPEQGIWVRGSNMFEVGGNPPLNDDLENASGNIHGPKKGILAIETYPLTIVKAGSGTGNVTGPEIDCGTTCFGVFPKGMAIELTAIPDVGSSFAGWSGDGCAGTHPCLIAINASSDVMATFKKVHKISLITNRRGRITPIEPMLLSSASDDIEEISIITVDSGGCQTVRILPDPGCHVSTIRVDGVLVDVKDTYTFRNIVADHAIAVHFATDSRSPVDTESSNRGVSR